MTAAQIVRGASLSTADRATYLGGSDIAAVAGLHPYKTGLDVFAAKVHGVEREVGPAAEVGLELEEGIARLYLKRQAVPEDATMAARGTLRDPALPWAAATPDRLIRLGPNAVRNVQIKVVGLSQAWRWDDALQGADGVPPEVLAQVTWEARAIERSEDLSVPESHVVALIGTDLRVYTVPTDRDLMGLLLDAGADFWREHIEKRRPPEITEKNAASACELIKRRYPRQELPAVPATSAMVELALAYDRARTEATAAEERKVLAFAHLTEAIGAAEGFASDDGMVKVTWKTNASGGADWKAIAEHLGATAAHQREFQRIPIRALRVKVGS
jgi:predicted phage-related endonuclease